MLSPRSILLFGIRSSLMEIEIIKRTATPLVIGRPGRTGAVFAPLELGDARKIVQTQGGPPGLALLIFIRVWHGGGGRMLTGLSPPPCAVQKHTFQPRFLRAPRQKIEIRTPRRKTTLTKRYYSDSVPRIRKD